MRPPRPFTLRAAVAGLVLAAGGVLPAAAQSPGNPFSACFTVRLIQPPTGLDADDRVLLSSEVVEFIFEPGQAWARGIPETWRLDEAPRAEEFALWWPDEGDTLVAVWMRGGEPLTMRLQATGNRLLGLAQDTFSGAGRREVDAVRTTCPGVEAGPRPR
jgi:hypothetical protein